jgi:shikimate dehydrogenase
MHNAAFQALGLPYVYQAFDVQPQNLAEAVRGMRALGFRGFNVTIPHKVAVMSLLDEQSEEATGIGAVNTVVIGEDGKLYGTNTDGLGYLRSLREETGIHLRGAKVVLLGAGGAARAVGYTLLKEGIAALRIANRSRERAEQLAVRLKDAFANGNAKTGANIAIGALDGVPRWLPDADLLLNTTSVGMYPHVDASPIRPDWLRQLPPEAVVSDLIYNPRKTRLLSEAERYGLRIHGGLGMFLYQGAEAFRLWTGQEAPLAVMRRAVSEAGGPDA